MRKFVLKATLIAAALCGAGSAAVAAEPIVIKLSHVAATDSAKGKAALKFKELAEEKTHGKVTVEVFANSTLYKDKEELEALQLGAVHMLIPAVAKFGPLGLSDFDVFDLPYMFPDMDGLHRVTQGPIGQNLLAKLEKRAIKGLAFWDNSFVMFSANKPLLMPQDMKGLKMRSYSKIIDAQYRALGALPQNMAFSEMYQGLQTGVIDGQDTVPANMWTQKIFEVQKHATLTFHRHPVYALIASKKWWDALPTDVRAGLEEAVTEATRYNNAIAQKENAEAIERMRASGKIALHQPTADELAAWRNALLPVRKEMESRIGKDLIRSVEQTASNGK